MVLWTLVRVDNPGSDPPHATTVSSPFAAVGTCNSFGARANPPVDSLYCNTVPEPISTLSREAMNSSLGWGLSVE